MASTFLISDHAVALAKVVVEMFNLRPEEEREAFRMVYEACSAMLQSYEAARMELRVLPSAN